MVGFDFLQALGEGVMGVRIPQRMSPTWLQDKYAELEVAKSRERMRQAASKRSDVRSENQLLTSKLHALAAEYVLLPGTYHDARLQNADLRRRTIALAELLDRFQQTPLLRSSVKKADAKRREDAVRFNNAHLSRGEGKSYRFA